MVGPLRYKEVAPWHSGEALFGWLLPRVLELTYTAWDLEPFARDCGYDGPPFRWDPERRALLRAELDAAFFHLYGISRDDADYILETFPIVKRYDIKAHGEYRTKRLILERYDALAAAITTGVPYQTVLDPPPADPRVAHPPRAAAPAADTATNESNRGKLIPFRRPPLVTPAESDKYRDCVPLYSLAAAAGAFSDPQHVTAEGWVRLRTHRKLAPGMFVARIEGRSMLPNIPDGSYGLFGPPPSGTPTGCIILAELQDLQDPETGARYTVKYLEIDEEKVGRGKKATVRRTARLVPTNPEVPTLRIPLTEDLARHLRILAELLDTLSDADYA